MSRCARARAAALSRASMPSSPARCEPEARPLDPDPRQRRLALRRHAQRSPARCEDMSLLQAKGHALSASRRCSPMKRLDANGCAAAATRRSTWRPTTTIACTCRWRDACAPPGTCRGGCSRSTAPPSQRVPGLFARNERVVCAFDGEHGPFVVVLVGALFVGSMSTVWHGEITPWRGRRRHARHAPGRTPAAATPTRRAAVAAARRRARPLQHGLDRDAAAAARQRRAGMRPCSPAPPYGVGQALGLVCCRPEAPAVTRGSPTASLRDPAAARRSCWRAARGFFAERARARSRHARRWCAMRSPTCTSTRAQVQLPGHAAPLYPAHLARVRDEASAGRRQRRYLSDRARVSRR